MGNQTNDLLPEPRCHCSCSANCYPDSAIGFGSRRGEYGERESERERWWEKTIVRISRSSKKISPDMVYNNH